MLIQDQYIAEMLSKDIVNQRLQAAHHQEQVRQATSNHQYRQSLLERVWHWIFRGRQSPNNVPNHSTINDLVDPIHQTIMPR